MHVMSISEAINLLKASGPYGIIVLLGIGYIRKDKQLEAMMDKLVILTEAKTQADLKLTTAIDGLKDMIMVISHKK